MASQGLAVWTNNLDRLVLPLNSCATSWRDGTALSALRAKPVHPLASRNVSQANAESVVTAVAFVTKHHLLLVMCLATLDAGLAVRTLPRIRPDHVHHLRG